LVHLRMNLVILPLLRMNSARSNANHYY
jgi:hypothetical protein